MKLVHLSDIHVWRYALNPIRLMNKRLIGMAELLSGRASKFRVERIHEVVERAVSLRPDHVLVTGDLTTTALRSEFAQAREALEPLVGDPGFLTVIPGNHDRYTTNSVRTRAFERTFGEFAPSTEYPWLRWLDGRTAILGLDATRSHLSATGRLPERQFLAAKALLEQDDRPARLIVACHYPVAAPEIYRDELRKKRMVNASEVARWLTGLGPHLYCCGHVHAAWAFHPEAIPGQLCLNAGAPLLRDPTGRRPPGFLEIDLGDEAVNVRHHAWTGTEWSIVPMVEGLRHYERARDDAPASRP